MQLDGPQTGLLRDALVEIFPRPQNLEMMVYIKLNVELNTITGDRDDKLFTAFQLVRWANAQNRVEELILAAHEQNSHDPRILQIANSLNISLPTSVGPGRPTVLLGSGSLKSNPETSGLLPIPSPNVTEQSQESYSLPFDQTLCRDASLGDINMKTVTSFSKEARVQKNLGVESKRTKEGLLEHFELSQEAGKVLTYGAILCFGKNPSKRIQGAYIRCISWSGNDRITRSKGDQECHESLLVQYAFSIGFLRSNLRHSRVGSSEQWEIPDMVLRETLANALIHREYANQNDGIRVEIFANRIEISSPGTLPEGLTIPKPGEEAQTRYRNPNIARVFYLCNHVEKLGTGIARIRRDMQDAGLPQPEFDTNNGRFNVVLMRPQRAVPDPIRESTGPLNGAEPHAPSVPMSSLDDVGPHAPSVPTSSLGGAEPHAPTGGTSSLGGAEPHVPSVPMSSLGGAEPHVPSVPMSSLGGAEPHVPSVPMSSLGGAEPHAPSGGTSSLDDVGPHAPSVPMSSLGDAEPHLPSGRALSSRVKAVVSNRRNQWRALILGIILLVVPFVIYSFPSLFPSASMGIGIINEPHNEQIGLSDGTYAFDTGPDRADASRKILAAAKFAKGDKVGATSLWSESVGKNGVDTSDAEALIYQEDQNVLDSGLPYVTLVVGTMLTGPPNNNNITSGRADLQGAYVAQKEYNDGLKIGKKVRLLIANAGSNPDYVTEVTGQIVQAVKQDPTIVGVMGWSFSAYAQKAIPVLTQAHIPLVSSTATADSFTKISRYFFRVVPSNKGQAIAGAKYAERQLQASRVALFVDPKNPYTKSLAADFREQFVADGYQIVDTENYKVGDKANLPAHLQSALQSNPNLIYFSGYADDLAVLLANFPASQPDLQVLGGDGLYAPNAYTNTAKLNFGRVRFTTFAYPDEWGILGLKDPAFFSEYSLDFNPKNVDHSANPYGFTRADFGTILAYDATFALLQGCRNILLAKKSLTAVSLRDGLARITGAHAIQGVSGQISFGSDGDPINKALVILYVDQDKHIHMLPGVQGCFLVEQCR